jgi:hypothetical protein
MTEIDLDPPLIDSWALLYSEATQDQKASILASLCKYISVLNFFDRRDWNAYILKRARELNEQDKIEAYRRQKAADLKKLDDRIMERKRSLK